jgi:integrase
MAKSLHRLSAAKITKLAKPGMFCDGGGLYLQASLGTDGEIKKSWIFRFALHGRERQMGLGSLHTIGLAEAREKATECRRQCLEGIDPIAARDILRAAAAAENAKAKTFDECAEEYIRAQRGGWRNGKHIQQWTNSLKNYASPVFGRLPVSSIDTSIIVKSLAPIWETKPETAGRVRGRVERVLDWARVRGYRTGDNPARWQGNLEHLLSERSQRVEHYTALPYAEIGAFMAELRERDGVAARALEFAILTAGRTGEVLGARWDEIDLQAKVWVVPPDRMKAGKEHRVPLSAAAVAMLERLAKVRENEFIFSGTSRAILSNMAMLAVLKRMGRGNLTVHGFRSAFRTWASEQTSFAHEVCEQALAHTIPSAVERAYQRGTMFDKRRRLMDAWGQFCAKPASDTGKVLPLRSVS